MTREEAIKVLSTTAVTPHMHADNMQQWDDALGLAVEALEMVVCGFGDYADNLWEEAFNMGKGEVLCNRTFREDCISRKSAIEACNNGVCACVSDCVDEIKKLPSIGFTARTAHWTTKRKWNHDGGIYCSVCDCDAPIEGDYRQVKTEYCPHCGAKMESVCDD